MKHVIVVGGGITGLTAARGLGSSVKVTVLEASDRLGGNIRTEKVDGFVIDAGPDSWVTSKPAATALAKELGLTEQLIDTVEENRRVYIAFGKTLHPLPEGLVLGVPTQITPLIKSELFGWDAKLRMGLEAIIPPRAWRDDEDESITSFFSRRFGDELTDKLAAPLLGGIFAGDASDISVRSAFPQLVEMERTFGSLTRAMRARAKNPGKGGAFVSLIRGVGSLVEAVASSIDAEIRVSARVVRLTPVGPRFEVGLATGESLLADDVVLTAPAHALAPLLGFDATAADHLAELRYASTATVFLGLERSGVEHPLDATGFLVPRSLGRPLLASTWVTSKWPHRAPKDRVLLRAFFGGAAGEEVLGATDEDLVELAREELERFMGKLGRPLLARVYRHVRASPQPVIGHAARMRAVFERLPGGIHLAGNGYDGSGIPDCVKQGERAARAVLARHSLSRVESAAPLT